MLHGQARHKELLPGQLVNPSVPVRSFSFPTCGRSVDPSTKPYILYNITTSFTALISTTFSLG